jgi:hypothetical protein
MTKEDNVLLDIYYVGFDIELTPSIAISSNYPADAILVLRLLNFSKYKQCDFSSIDYKLLVAAYRTGMIHALAGDDSSNIRSMSREQILKEIKEYVVS